MNENPQFNEKFLQVRERFVQKLQSWATDFEALEQTLAQPQPSIDNVENIREKIHKLAGSAGTFGFPELNEHAINVESILDDMIEGVSLAELSAPLQHAIRDLLASIRQITHIET